MSLFISLEGMDGCGKSTQARLLKAWLEETGREAVLTREPGGSPGAEEIRTLLLSGDPGRWSCEAELLLFAAARRDHVERTIQPALEHGRIVVCDRFADSTRVYQARAREGMREIVDRLHDLMIACEPDLTLLIDVDPETALSRANRRGGRENRFESLGMDVHRRIREGFLELARECPQRFRVFDGNRSEDEVAQAVRDAVSEALP